MNNEIPALMYTTPFPLGFADTVEKRGSAGLSINERQVCQIWALTIQVSAISSVTICFKYV